MSRKLSRQSSNIAVDSSVPFGENNGSEHRMQLNFNDIESTFKRYAGDGTASIRKWLDEFERAALAFKWDDMQKYFFCKRLLTGVAKLYIECEARPLDYLTLKRVLLKEYENVDCSAEIHKKLRLRKKKENEDLLEYLYCMIDIAAQGNVDENSIISYVIDGIQDNAANKIMLFGAKSMREFKEKLKIYREYKECSEFKNNGMQEFKNPKCKQNRYRCYNCGSGDHEFHNCPHKSIGPKCFKCNKFGHKASNCSEQVTTHPVMSNNVNLYETFRPIKVNNVTIAGLIDTGSYHCVIKERLLNYVGASNVNYNSNLVMSGLVSETMTKGTFTASIEFDNISFNNVLLHVVETNPSAPDIIIGMDLLKNLKMTMDGGKLTFETKTTANTGELITLNNNTNSGCFLAKIEDIFESNDISVNQADLSHLCTKPIFKDIKQLVTSYNPSIPSVSPIQMKIVTTDEVPIYHRPRRFPPAEQKAIDEQIEQWIHEGIVVPSSSNYASNVVLVKKKDGSNRLCVDFRALNKKILGEHFPLPIIEDQVDKLQDAHYFSTLDLENAFFYVNVEQNSRKFTSFVTQRGQFEFVKVPFGLSNSPCVFQKYINFVFKDLLYDGIVIIYIDDIVIPSKDIYEGFFRLKKVLEIAAANGLKIKWKKCQLFKTEIEYLGFCVKNGTIQPSPIKLKAIVNFPLPTTMKKLQSFLGLANYFRRFIPSFASKARPLTNLIKRNQQNVKVDKEGQEAFKLLKQDLISPTVMKFFRYGAMTELHTDASKDGFGAVLLQKCMEDETFHPVYYYSKKTSEAETNYTSYELEVLAIIQAVKKFRIYLMGQNFKIVTDCKAFECTMRKKDLTTRVARWALLLEEFDYTLEHRSGTKMRHVDALSRNPIMCLTSSNNFLNKIKELQQSDERLKAIIEILKEKPYLDYILQNGILFKHVNNNMLIVAPDGMKNNIIKDVHEKGHFHYKKMKEIIEKEFFIDNLQQRINRHIMNCIPCILSERKKGKPEGFLNPIPKGDIPLEVFHIDHLGPMQATKKGYRYILAVIDGFTKFSWLFPLKSLAAEETIKKLEIIAETFGYPSYMIADRGGTFIANSFKNYCAEHGVKLSHITVGTPRGNGQVERLNSIVISSLTKLAINDKEKWYAHVKPVQMFINATYQRSIRMSPFKLMIGTDMKINLTPNLIQTVEEEIINNFDESRHLLRETAKQGIADIQKENKKYYDQRRKPARLYKIGDLVAIEKIQFGVTQKIRPKFLGPYQVVAVKAFDRYDVKKCGETEGPTQTNTSADKMKPWQEIDSDEETTYDRTELYAE